LNDSVVSVMQGKRAARFRPLLLQERDLDMLYSIAEGHYLTVPSLEWLHFASWRRRYRAAGARATDPAAWPYQPSSNLYRRIAGLWRSGYLQRIIRPLVHARMLSQRLVDAYTLTRAGADLLCDQRGDAIETLCAAALRRSRIPLAQRVALGQWYAAIRAEVEEQGLALEHWQSGHVLARLGYDHMALAGRTHVSVLPDATFILAAQRYFVEIDQGTRSLPAWRAKLQAYAAYHGSLALRTRYHTSTFTVLVVAPTQPRINRIAAQVAHSTLADDPPCRFLLEQHVHPLTIQRGWQGIAPGASDGATVQWSPWALWQPRALRAAGSD
jgi:hypothetical protein